MERDLKTILEDFARDCRATASAAHLAMNSHAAQAKQWETDWPEAAARRRECARWESLKRDRANHQAETAEAMAREVLPPLPLPPHPGY